MNITYGIVKETYEYGNTYQTVYGVAIYTDNETEQTPIVIKSFSNLTSNYERLHKLVCLCNSLQLSLYHIDDVIEDFINDI